MKNKKETISKNAILKDMTEWEAICHEKIKEANEGDATLEKLYQEAFYMGALSIARATIVEIAKGNIK